jgi:hypothetical protein
VENELMRKQQVSTSPTTIEAIMATREFALGVIDGRAGRGHRSDYATWGIDEQWNYERGRQWAALVPRAVALKRDGKVTAVAKAWYRDEIL